MAVSFKGRNKLLVVIGLSAQKQIVFSSVLQVNEWLRWPHLTILYDPKSGVHKSGCGRLICSVLFSQTMSEFFEYAFDAKQREQIFLLDMESKLVTFKVSQEALNAIKGAPAHSESMTLVAISAAAYKADTELSEVWRCALEVSYGIDPKGVSEITRVNEKDGNYTITFSYRGLAFFAEKKEYEYILALQISN
jgi:hypothetical protein